MLYKIKALSDVDFENLTHDLMICLGVRNIAWRSPGADGGRDIEGVYLREDPTGDVFSESWFIECKKYSSSISWPVIYSKISYAESNRADVLLLVTSAKITPNCQTEISKWNALRRGLRIAYLDAPRLVAKLQDFPLVLAKYGLVNSPAQYPVSFKVIAGVLANLCSVAEAEIEFSNNSVAADAAFELSRLVAVRISQIETNGGFEAASKRKGASPAWLSGCSELTQELSCFLAYLRYLIRAKEGFSVTPIKGEDYDWSVDLRCGSVEFIHDPSIEEISLWARVQFKINNLELKIREH